jgi:hypothetical protein
VDSFIYSLSHSEYVVMTVLLQQRCVLACSLGPTRVLSCMACEGLGLGAGASEALVDWSFSVSFFVCCESGFVVPVIVACCVKLSLWFSSKQPLVHLRSGGMTAYPEASRHPIRSHAVLSLRKGLMQALVMMVQRRNGDLANRVRVKNEPCHGIC